MTTFLLIVIIFMLIRADIDRNHTGWKHKELASLLTTAAFLGGSLLGWKLIGVLWR